ncbi:hypothetical protein GLOTRDRAFT_122756 [Gloeophyllum trabeum ATCC 11539]|uniref:F-box domain-containing protein n=1 Tax=Gloeophyllum trabeum (strain ATCC 11539 / FP-39264 / Madison 617) TaxID=670483 RepID=S7PWZ7_GLOTA|nr:uncharacterized protein GLOTRDRAFT_122756 [Gloeophyllum trabeum ATCC 11539]EPQ52003.1 hypothetical protein GLOTRDRAFT_122756 [Gloeophyllum trabeum ATCC 11539]
MTNFAHGREETDFARGNHVRLLTCASRTKPDDDDGAPMEQKSEEESDETDDEDQSVEDKEDNVDEDQSVEDKEDNVDEDQSVEDEEDNVDDDKAVEEDSSDSDECDKATPAVKIFRGSMQNSRIVWMSDSAVTFRNKVCKLRRTLFNASLTCRAMHEPALDALWRRLDSLDPIFKLIRSFRHQPQPGSARDKEYKQQHSVDKAHAMKIVWQDLLSGAPNLQSLLLRDMPTELSLKGVQNLKQLRTIRVDGRSDCGLFDHTASLSYRDLRALSHLDDLVDLRANVHGIVLPDKSAPLFFKSLQRVELKGPPSSITSVLTLLRHVPLQHVHAHVGLGDRPRRERYEALFRSFSFPDLRHLSMQFEDELQRENMEAEIVLDAQALIPPLLGCSQLVHFEMQLSNYENQIVLMDNDDLLDVAEAWPRLEYFGWDFGYHQSRIPTLVGLHAFMKNCSDLRYLRITLDVNAPLPDTPESLPISGHGLKTLVLYGPSMWPPNAKKAAPYITALFPAIKPRNYSYGSRVQFQIRPQRRVIPWSEREPIYSSASERHSIWR